MAINLKLDVHAGGIFSKFMWSVQNLNNIYVDFDLAYINNIDAQSLTDDQNIFNNIFDQTYDTTFESHTCNHVVNYSKFNPIEYSPNLTNYKKIVNKLKFTNQFIDNFNKIVESFKINDSFIGVHIRLCDMNITHGADYGIVNYDDFLNEIKKHITSETNIFVSSDNDESISKLKQDLDNKIYYMKDFIRGKSEIEHTNQLQLKYFKDSKFWQEAFIDMLLLSKCGKLICRTSNLNNTSIIYSNTIKEIIRL